MNEIDLDEVEYINARKSRINKIDMMDAVFMRGRKVINVSSDIREEFRFTGLNTMSFAVFVAGDVNAMKCQWCDTAFITGAGTGRRSKSKFCSDKCRKSSHVHFKKLKG